MRFGQNPAKFAQDVAKHEDVTVAMLTYVPALAGYHAQGLDVIRASLGSLWAHTDAPHDLLVFDNGSCEQVRAYLLDAAEQKKIQVLILSDRNVGKGGAWNVIFGAAPGSVIAYSDWDAEFSPGWLSKSLEILDTFPNVGMVTSRPFRTDANLCSSTLDWAQETEGVELRRGQFIPWETFREFDMSLGQEESEVRARYERTLDVRLTYRGVCAQVGASHWQFVAHKRVLREFLPFDMNRPMGQVRELDRRMDAAGYLRLMTCEPLAMNLSNSTIKVPAADLDRSDGNRRSLPFTVLQNRWVKRALLGLYDRIFRWYFGPAREAGGRREPR